MLYFLERKDLCGQGKNLRHLIVQAHDEDMKLSTLVQHNKDLSQALHFEEDVLLALKTFCRGSVMFEARFDNYESLVGSDNNAVIVKTKAALQGMKDLVSNPEVRINDFGMTLDGLIAEMTSRRRSAVILELEGIAHFFSISAKTTEEGTGGSGRHEQGMTDNILSETLANLQAAFNLMRYRDVLMPFRTALIDLKLLPEDAIAQLESSDALYELHSNFLVTEAPALLTAVQGALHGLSHAAVTLVGKLSSADLLLLFLRKHGQSFEGDLDRAQDRSASNVLVTNVLLLLSSINALLEPFYNRTLLSVADMKTHLDANLRMSADGQECLSVAHLLNICENWDEVEIFFKDSGQTNSGTDDIQRFVRGYQEKGQFVSSLSAHPGGSTLSLVYLQKGGTLVSLPPEQLQTHVQWAVLGGEVAVLEEFVSAFSEAQLAQAIRLKLEEVGHPDHQAVNPPCPLAPTCQLRDVSAAVVDLSRQLEEWNESTAHFGAEVPRLLLLNRRSRVHLILALRGLPALNRLAEQGIFPGDNFLPPLPYVIQCFPSLLEKRLDMQKAVRHFFLRLKENELSDLGLAGYLLSQVQSYLEDTVEGFKDGINLLPTDETYAPTRLDLQGASAVEIYCQHLSHMVSQTARVGQPGTVLWGERGTTEHAVRDLLLVAGTSLTGAVHVVGVDRLTPRIREVLLRGIEHTTLRTPLLLIFGDRDGADTFAQYESEGVPEERKPSDVRFCLWASLKHLSGTQNGEVWVVTGKSGTGKSYWIERNLRERTKKFRLQFAVHEGFSVDTVIDRFKRCVSGGSGDILVELCFNVLHVAPFEVFSRFLHHLLALGLIIDDDGGKCFAVAAGVRLHVYIELPEVEGSPGESSSWPPRDDQRWTASQHPFLQLLPVLVVAVAPDHYISVRENDAFVVGSKAQHVASYLDCAKELDEFNRVEIPCRAFANLLSDAQSAVVLQQELFDKYKVNTSKRVRSYVVRLLYDRFLYLEKIRLKCVPDTGEEEGQSSLQYRMEHSLRSCSGLVYLFVREALDVASDATHLPDTSVFTVRPLDALDFEVVVTSQTEEPSRDFHELSTSFMNTKRLSLATGSIPPTLRACVAPAFGMEDTSALLSTLEDCGHLLTPESLIRIMHMHGRRMLGASVIYEGETGVGKSQNLKLYSQLINANTSLFANLKLHLVAVVRAVAQSRQNAGQEEDMEGEGAASDLSSIDISSSIEQVKYADPNPNPNPRLRVSAYTPTCV